MGLGVFQPASWSPRFSAPSIMSLAFFQSITAKSVSRSGVILEMYSHLKVEAGGVGSREKRGAQGEAQIAKASKEVDGPCRYGGGE